MGDAQTHMGDAHALCPRFYLPYEVHGRVSPLLSPPLLSSLTPSPLQLISPHLPPPPAPPPPTPTLPRPTLPHHHRGSDVGCNHPTLLPPYTPLAAPAAEGLRFRVEGVGIRV